MGVSGSTALSNYVIGKFGRTEVEQKEPVRRTVALKIIEPGMETSDFIARFEAERQALALMERLTPGE